MITKYIYENFKVTLLQGNDYGVYWVNLIVRFNTWLMQKVVEYDPDRKRVTYVIETYDYGNGGKYIPKNVVCHGRCKFVINLDKMDYDVAKRMIWIIKLINSLREFGELEKMIRQYGNEDRSLCP